MSEPLVALLNDRTPARADLLGWETTYVVGQSDIVVNATPVGLYPDVDGRLDVGLVGVGPDTVVADVIPNPPRTRLLREAEARGATVLDGLAMLVAQGAIAIRHWTGVDPDPAVMRRVVEALFPRRPSS